MILLAVVEEGNGRVMVGTEELGGRYQSLIA
jgi:hypothetical protein